MRAACPSRLTLHDFIPNNIWRDVYINKLLLCAFFLRLMLHKRAGILILATPRWIGYKNCWSDEPMQLEGWVLPLPTYIMGAVHHEMGIRSSQLIVSRSRDSV